MDSNPHFYAAVEKLPGLYRRLMDCPLSTTQPRSAFRKKPGVYVLYDGDNPIYVGRAKNLWKRIGNHVSYQPAQSTFAIKRAREIKKNRRPIRLRVA